MIVQTFDAGLPPELEPRLEVFERQFSYPLGEGRRFRISHCGDYAGFYRAIGPACTIVAEHRDGIVGVLCVALRDLIHPDGSSRPVGYLGDLKIAPEARGGFVLARLAHAARDWLGGRVTGAFGIAMGGTGVLPTQYTGRAGVPLFEDLAMLTILRVETAGMDIGAAAANPDDVHACFRRLSAGQFGTAMTDSKLRSQLPSTPLLHENGSACGILEDTRKAKRLFRDDGHELLSAHLSEFAFADAAAGAELVRAACGLAGVRGMPALFFSVPAALAPGLVERLSPLHIEEAPATVFGTGLPGGHHWRINTAEI